MGLIIIKRTSCDICEMEQPSKHYEYPIVGGEVFVICANCVKTLGAMDGNELYQFGVKAGALQGPRTCPHCDEAIRGLSWGEAEIKRDLQAFRRNLGYGQ
jgi:hypothetical protein